MKILLDRLTGFAVIGAFLCIAAMSIAIIMLTEAKRDALAIEAELNALELRRDALPLQRLLEEQAEKLRSLEDEDRDLAPKKGVVR